MNHLLSMVIIAFIVLPTPSWADCKWKAELRDLNADSSQGWPLKNDSLAIEVPGEFKCIALPPKSETVIFSVLLSCKYADSDRYFSTRVVVIPSSQKFITGGLLLYPHKGNASHSVVVSADCAETE